MSLGLKGLSNSDWVMYYLEIQGLPSQFKDFARLYANSRTFQDKQSNSKAFKYQTTTKTK